MNKYAKIGTIAVTLVAVSMLMSVGNVAASTDYVWGEFETPDTYVWADASPSGNYDFNFGGNTTMGDKKDAEIEAGASTPRGTGDYMKADATWGLNSSVHIYKHNSGWQGSEFTGRAKYGSMEYRGTSRVTYSSPEPLQRMSVSGDGYVFTDWGVRERASSHTRQFGFEIEGQSRSWGGTHGAWTNFSSEDDDYNVNFGSTFEGPKFKVSGSGEQTHVGSDGGFNDKFGINATFNVETE